MQRTLLCRSRASLAATGVVLCGALASLSLVSSPTASAATPVTVGVVGDASALSSATGVAMPIHAYGQMSGSVPSGAMISMHSGVSWRTVSSAAPGSAVYNDIVRWATTLKARGGTQIVGFHHEPEASGNTALGTSSEYVAAYRKVVSIFRGAGAANVQFAWQMTGYAFNVASGDARAAAKWYPGDDVVTYVASDPYNFFTCGPGRNVWRELSDVAGGSLTFATAHGKRLILAEFASQVDGSNAARRAAWLSAATSWMVANRASIAAVYYFNTAHRSTCQFPLKTSTEFGLYASLSRSLG